MKAGTNSKLTTEQIEILKQKIIKNNPDQIVLFFNLWTLKSIKLLIKNLWKIEVSPRTVCSYIRRLGFTPQKPIKQAYKRRNPQAVRKWLEKDYPKIKKKAKKEKAEIHWVNETGLRPDKYYGRSYSQKGKTPRIRIDTRRVRVNFISY